MSAEELRATLSDLSRRHGRFTIARRVAMIVAPPLWCVAIFLAGFTRQYVLAGILTVGYIVVFVWLLHLLDRRRCAD
jgi:hypothetical protein